MNLRLTVTLAMVFLVMGTYAQSTRTATEDIIRCYTVEADEIRRANDPSLGTLEDFESWMAPKVKDYEIHASALRAVVTLPIVFHIIHNNGADNLNAAYVSANIAQLNDDFRKTGNGFNNHPDGADSEIEWCAATIDPNGNVMAEPGINRVSRSSAGFSTPPYSQNYYESTIKPNTIWDPSQYCNVWVSALSGGLLGYAQFPEAGSLPGIGTGNGGANTDGVVVAYTSVGGYSLPNPNGGVYDGGRTLTHELGHWLGLRHIWGDGNCNVDDYCNDTPRARSSTSGCPTKNTCNDLNYGASSNPNDMVENYMDYSYDDCMNIFTDDQKARMQVVLSSSIRRASLTTSTKCGGGGGGDTESPTDPTNLTASNETSSTVDLSWNASSDNVGVTGYNVYIDGSLLGTVTGTSAAVTGLSASTTYVAGVRARDAVGNLSGQASTSFTTLAASCVDGSLTLTIVLDNYPEETSWTVTSGGSTVASGGTYGSHPDGSTVVENINLGNGDYTFTINDSYGDGICCQYGSGSYTLTSGGTTVASGGSFTSSEATSFCASGGGGDTEAPSTPANVNTVNIAKTTATAVWTASSDNVGVTGYSLYLDGSLIGSTTATSANLSGLTHSTTYTVCVSAIDAAGNESAQGCDGFTTLAAPDDEDPTAPTNVTAFNVAETSADVSWTASTDNEGVVSYNVYLGGTLVENVGSTSTSLTGLTANTSYTVSVTALDVAGNESASGSDAFTTTGGGGGPSSEELFAHYFESGWDGWVDGGSDCFRYNGSRSYEGNRSIRIRDNSGSKSSMTLNNVDVTGWDQLDLNFYFYPNSMENNEDFWVRVNDGSGWQTVATYTSGTDFNNNTFYNATVSLSANDFTFNSGFDFRIQCDASANSDRVYVDQVILTGINNGRNTGTTHYLEELSSVNESGLDAESDVNESVDLVDVDLAVYPNPARDHINLVTSANAEWVKIYSVAGMLVAQERLVSEGVNTIDISKFTAGTYIIHIQAEGEVLYEKFIKYE